MYETFFGLQERPFDLVPNPRFLFLAGRHKEAFSNLRYGLSVPRGLTLLVGEAGTGKTTVVQAALAQIDRTSVDCVLLSNPTLTRSEFYEYLAIGFRLSEDAAASKTQFLLEMRSHLEARHATGGLSAVVVDEAQSLPVDLLEEIRLLSNIETATTKLLNVVLAGQPELSQLLNEPRLRQLKQRISLRCELGPLDFQETAAYIAGRIRIAGGNPMHVFTRGAVELIYEASGGIPRTINVICDNAMIGAFAEGRKPVVTAMVDDVCRDFDMWAANNLPMPAPASPAPAAAGEPSLAQEPAVVAAQATAAAALAQPAPMFTSFSRRRRFAFFRKAGDDE
jgi:general secretion pathway protein A